jgi:hypothetical protein
VVIKARCKRSQIASPLLTLVLLLMFALTFTLVP